MTVELVEAWLASKGVTLWCNWNIQDPVQRRQAAVWFVSQARELTQYNVDQARQSGPEWDVVA